jgi:hypothetical protein
MIPSQLHHVLKPCVHIESSDSFAVKVLVIRPLQLTSGTNPKIHKSSPVISFVYSSTVRCLSSKLLCQGNAFKVSLFKSLTF